MNAFTYQNDGLSMLERNTLVSVLLPSLLGLVFCLSYHGVDSRQDRNGKVLPPGSDELSGSSGEIPAFAKSDDSQVGSGKCPAFNQRWYPPGDCSASYQRPFRDVVARATLLTLGIRLQI